MAPYPIRFPHPTSLFRWDEEKDDAKDKQQSVAAESADVGGSALPTRYEARESWGEAHAHEREPRLFVLDWRSGVFTDVLEVGDREWGPLASYLASDRCE